MTYFFFSFGKKHTTKHICPVCNVKTCMSTGWDFGAEFVLEGPLFCHHSLAQGKKEISSRLFPDSVLHRHSQIMDFATQDNGLLEYTDC